MHGWVLNVILGVEKRQNLYLVTFPVNYKIVESCQMMLNDSKRRVSAADVA